MTGEILFKLVSALLPDDVRQLMAAGYGQEAGRIIDELDMLRLRWREREHVHVDRKVCSDIQVRLNELRAALRED